MRTVTMANDDWHYTVDLIKQTRDAMIKNPCDCFGCDDEFHIQRLSEILNNLLVVEEKL